MTRDTARTRAARATALWTLVIGFVASVLVGLSPASYLQARLRFGCAFVGEDWVCDDQAALLWPAIGIVALGALALGWAALIVRATWDAPRERAGQLAAIGIIAVAPTIVLFALLFVDALVHDAGGVSYEASRVAMWAERAMVPALSTALAGALAFVGLRVRAIGAFPRLATLQLAGAMLLLLGAAAMSSLGTLPSGIVAASAIAAGWTVAAATGPDRRARRSASATDVDPSRSRSTQ